MCTCSGSTKKYIKQIASTEEFKKLVSVLYNDMVKNEDESEHKKNKNIMKIQKRFEKSKYIEDLLMK
jgi:hypothetical protein